VSITASEARKNLFPLIEKVHNDRTSIQITSRRGDAVLLSRADYEALEETAHLLRSQPTPSGWSKACTRHYPASATSMTSPGEAGLHPPRLGGHTYWLSADRATLKRINRLTGDALRDPSAGIGKPEPLRHLLAGA
jgi:prevent-host-death family protein